MTRRITWFIIILVSLFTYNCYAIDTDSLDAGLQQEIKKVFKKYERIDFGKLDNYEKLAKVQEELFDTMNNALEKRPKIAFISWYFDGAALQRRLAKQADYLANLQRSRIKKKNRANDRQSANGAIRLWLLSAQAQRWSDYILESGYDFPYRVSENPDIAPGRIVKEPYLGYDFCMTWTVNPKQRIQEEILIRSTSYVQVWPKYFNKMIDIAKDTNNILGLKTLAQWIKKFRDSKLEKNTKSRMYFRKYVGSLGESLADRIYFKMLPDIERQTLDQVLAKVERELKILLQKREKFIEESGCKKMGNTPNMEEWQEELRCTDLAF